MTINMPWGHHPISQDKHRPMMSPNTGGPPRDVGVAIALHHQKQTERNHRHDHHPRHRKRNRQQPTIPRPWWEEFLFGTMLYLTCIYLPTCLRLVQSLYQHVWNPFLLSLTKRLGGDPAWGDVWIVMIMSTSMAALRISLVQSFVNMQSPQRVEAMVRCKSLHLLSSAYPRSLSPAAHKKVISREDLDHASPLPSLPPLTSSPREDDQKAVFQPRLLEMKSETYVAPEASPMKRSDSWLESTWESVRRSSEKALNLVEEHRLNAAPRYATAIFRCLYVSVSLTTAWWGFSDSNFWPPAVGGSGATKNCWNLKGSPGMEEDFDELNSLLKFYYLLQASYHLHSAAFHVLTLGIMWTRHKKRPAQLANWRSILQHSIALVLIVGSHLFASTRRLGAIGSFVLDLSSLLLHALQVFINAPYSLDPTVVKVVHLGLVIPVFVYCRFYVWPFVVWRSAWLESKDWLQQMESTLFPGIYVAMMWVFHGLTLILLGLNMVLLKRLVNHPHLQRVYDKRRRQARSRSNVSPILS